jgi:DNA-binding NarL/FixJ family response regulator
MLLDSQHIKVTGTYLNGGRLLEGLSARQPDVLLLDVLLPDIKGEDLVTTVLKSWSGIQIIAITSLDAPVHIRTMMRKGCKGYLLKNVDVHILVEAIEHVFEGKEYIDPSLKELMFQNLLQYRKASQKVPSLTRREQEILHLITKEMTNHEITQALHISIRTVEKHRFSLMQKLDAKNTAGLVKTAIELGLIE